MEFTIIPQKHFRNLMYSLGDIFVTVYSAGTGFSLGLLLLCYLCLFSSTVCPLLPCSRVVWQYRTHKQTQCLFLLFLPLILSPLFHSTFCFRSLHMSLQSSQFMPLSFSLFLLSLTLCHSRFVSLSVSVSVPDSSNRGSVCGKGKLIV